jgi:glyoxylate/succinic semialdehyde reductase
MCAGSRSLYDQIADTDLKSMGKASFFLSENVGKASEMKLVVNLIMGGMMSALVEGTALAKHSQLDLQSLHDILSLGAMASPMLKGKLPRILEGVYETNFPLKHQQKDMRLALELAETCSLSLPVSTASNDLYVKACEMGCGEKDFSAVYLAVKKDENEK